MFTKILTFAVCLWSALPVTTGHVYRMGECPPVEAMVDFDMDKFLGEWFIIQKFRSTSDCVKENFTMLDSGDYFVTRTANMLGSPVITTVSGKIYFPRNGSQSEMEVDYPLSTTGVINIKSYTVLATDYDNYALVWNCQPMLIGHRQSAQIMSRNSTLDKKMVIELRELLTEFQLNEHYLSIVKQNDCKARLDFHEPNGHGDKPLVSVNGVYDCDKEGKPGKRGDSTRSGISVRVGPFHFSALLPFK